MKRLDRDLSERCRHAVLLALIDLGGEAADEAILKRAISLARFSAQELSRPAPRRSEHREAVAHYLAAAPGWLERDRLAWRPGPGRWALLAPHAPTAERLTQLRAMPHTAYRRTPEWQARRAAALERAGWSCSRGADHDREGLDVVHRSYDRLGAEQPGDLVVLCRECRARPPVGAIASPPPNR